MIGQTLSRLKTKLHIAVFDASCASVLQGHQGHGNEVDFAALLSLFGPSWSYNFTAPEIFFV